MGDTHTQTVRKLCKTAFLLSAKMSRLKMENSFVYEAQYLCHSFKTSTFLLAS